MVGALALLLTGCTTPQIITIITLVACPDGVVEREGAKEVDANGAGSAAGGSASLVQALAGVSTIRCDRETP